MSGGVLLIDYDRDQVSRSIIFTGCRRRSTSAIEHQSARIALYHNDHDGTNLHRCYGRGRRLLPHASRMAPRSGDYNNDGWQDLYITCLGANVMYRNITATHVH